MNCTRQLLAASLDLTYKFQLLFSIIVVAPYFILSGTICNTFFGTRPLAASNSSDFTDNHQISLVWSWWLEPGPQFAEVPPSRYWQGR